MTGLKTQHGRVQFSDISGIQMFGFWIPTVFYHMKLYNENFKVFIQNILKICFMFLTCCWFGSNPFPDSTCQISKLKKGFV